MLKGPDGPVEDTKSIINIVVDYYKQLFGREETLDINLDDDFWDPSVKVSNEYNRKLEANITEEDVRAAVFGSYAEGAPGPDGFPFLFYQQFWDTIKGDLMLLVDAWNNDSLDLYRLNFSLLTLIPKEPDADIIQKFRPIALTNCSFKIFAKCLANQLGDIGDEIISQNQTAFIKGRYIVESVVTAHEIIHDVVTNNREAFVFKLDYEKAYDRVSKEFLLKVMYQR